MDCVMTSSDPSPTETVLEQENRLISEAKNVLYARLRSPGPVLNAPPAARDFVRLQLGDREREVFAVLFLDAQHRLMEYREMFFGTVDSCSVYPREVVKAALRINAASVMFAHNHPSGLTEPSIADNKITQRLVKALDLLDIRVIDHLIVGGQEVTSFAEQGYL